jgi:hypothetical protein
VLGLQGKGERGKTHGPGGTGNPYKHQKPHPRDPTKVVEWDPHTGKEKVKPKPPGFQEWWDKKHPPRRTMCGESPGACLAAAAGGLAVFLLICLAPEIGIPTAAAAAAAAAAAPEEPKVH